MDTNIIRDKISQVESRLAELPQADVPVTHHYAKGVYGREMFIPKGTIIFGKIHRYETLNILVKGDITVVTETGRKRITPPFVAVSPPGTKRGGYAHEDSIWLCIHGTNETDLEKIEKEVIAKGFNDPLLVEELKRLSL